MYICLALEAEVPMFNYCPIKINAVFQSIENQLIVKSLSKIFEGTVYLTARNEERGLDSLKSLSAYKNIKFHPLDISDPKSIRNFAQHVKECYKGMFKTGFSRHSITIFIIFQLITKYINEYQ